MTFKQVQSGRVFMATFIVIVISVVVFFVLYTGYMISRMWDTFTQLDSSMTQEEQNQLLMDELEKINNEITQNPGWLNNLITAHWVVTGLTAFFVSRWTARRYAISPQQGAGYGVAIGLGVMLFYGLCIFTSSVNLLGQLAMLFLLVAFSGLGGQLGGSHPKPQTVPAHVPGMPPGAAGPTPPGSDANVYFNMGVAAAMGGRRTEARQHFGRVLQSQPRNVAAWLQLANLADTPVQAWEYIQQARAISPADPAVVQAVNTIWPQVKDQVQMPTPSIQPPYKGGALDDAAIPRSTLPGSRPPDAPDTPDEPLPPDQDDAP